MKIKFGFKNKELVIKLVVIFLITQILGLFVASTLIKENVQTTIVNENPNDPVNAIGIVAYILVFTAILLLIIMFVGGAGLLLKIMETLAVFGTSVIVLGSILDQFFPSLLVTLVLSLGLVASRWQFKDNVLLRNIAAIISIAGAGSLLGVSLGVYPVLLLLFLLAIYDLIAVFKTKHMLVLAKNVTGKNLAFTVALPTKEKQFELGTGDLVMPLVFASSALRSTKPEFLFPINWIPSITILIASLIGLIWTLNIAAKYKKPLPALPPQILLMIITFFVLVLLGFFAKPFPELFS